MAGIPEGNKSLNLQGGTPPGDNDILIVGTGSLGTLFAARLAQAGYPVTLLGSWPEGLKALNESGARWVDGSGTERCHPVRATDDPERCRGIRNAIVLVKAWQTERAARQLKTCLAEDGLALTLQNGLGNREILERHLGHKRVALGTTTTGATLLGPGLAREGGQGIISIEDHPRIGILERALRSASFKVEKVEDALSLLWGKLVINAAINPLTALLRVPNGELLERPAARLLMRDLAGEVASVARAEKIRLAFEDPAALAEDVARLTASNHSSMFQDILRGAPTEIDAICGAVTRLGEQHNIPTPLNLTCWRLIQALAQD